MHVDGCRDNAAAGVAKARAYMQRCAVETNDKPSLIYANVVSTLDEYKDAFIILPNQHGERYRILD